MKKFGKFLVTTFSLAAILGGAYYVYQNIIKKSEEEDTDDFDDFDNFDDFDDFDDLDDNDSDVENSSTADETESKRGYVTLDMDAMKADSEEKANEEADQDNVKVFDLNSDITNDDNE